MRFWQPLSRVMRRAAPPAFLLAAGFAVAQPAEWSPPDAFRGPPQEDAVPPVIPGAVGFGIHTRAGRGGRVYVVSNLAPHGPGSLAACVEASRPRVCIFETSGTIVLPRALKVRHPYITIAGQTAPSPGITLRGAGLVIETHDVLVQHLRIRVGDGPGGPHPGNRDGITLEANRGDTYNVVLDHLSVSWSTDELFSAWAREGFEIRDVTVRHSIFSEALSRSINPKGEHSAGLLVGRGARRVALIGNVFAFNGWRNPLVRDDSTDVVIVNNLIYGTRGARTDQIDIGTRGARDLPLRVSVVGNAFIGTPGRQPLHTISVRGRSATRLALFVRDNLGPLATADDWSVVHLAGRTRREIQAGSPPVWVPGLAPLPASAVEPFALRSAGARPADRDAVDRRIVESIRARTGGLIDSPLQVGGWPRLAETSRPPELPDAPHAVDAEGYTRLERWLHREARLVEGGES